MQGSPPDGQEPEPEREREGEPEQEQAPPPEITMSGGVTLRHFGKAPN